MFKDSTVYADDPRYLSLWLEIAETPDDFKKMAERRIGLKSAAFYAAYANCLASKGWKQLAHQVLESGAQYGPLPIAAKDLETTQKPEGPPPQLALAAPSLKHPVREISTIRLDLLYNGTVERCFEEIIIQARKLRASPVPRRRNPAKPPTPVPTIVRPPDAQPYMEMRGVQVQKSGPAQFERPAGVEMNGNSRAWASSGYPNVHSQGVPQPSQAPRAPPPKKTLSRSPSRLASHVPPRPQSKGALPTDIPNLPLQEVALDSLPITVLTLPDMHPPPLPPIVDTSLPEVRSQFLGRIIPVLHTMGDVFVLNNMEKRGSSIFKRQNLPQQLRLTNIVINLRKIIGQGGYGTIYSAVNPVTNVRYALKLERTNIPWEWYVVNMARSRLRDDRALSSIINVFYYEGYRDEQYMLMPLIHYDSLLNVANHVRNQSFSSFDIETLSAYFAIELLRTIESLHSHNIIHGDLKAENVMLRAPMDRSLHDGYLSKEYYCNGDGKWAEYGVLLLDFGRSIDLELFRPDQKFRATWTPDDDQDCWEIRNHQPWTFQTDYYGIASIVHLLLFGKYLRMRDENGMRKITQPFKRSMQSGMWTSFFSVLLNPEMAKTSMIEEMGRVRSILESWLENDGTASVTIHTIISDVAYALRRKRLI